MKNKAFTLAEVLITLGIIGVVAAMTLPSVIGHYKEKETVVRLKHAYSVFSQAHMRAIIANGPSEGWGIGNFATMDGAVKLYNIYKPFLLKLQDCSDKYGCFFEGDYKALNGTRYGYQPREHSMYARGMLANGVSFAIASGGNGCEQDFSENGSGRFSKSCGIIYVDINGYKNPNQAGVDYFAFVITLDGIYPFGSIGMGAGENGYICKHKDSSSGNGIGCTAWVLYKENMDYLRRDISDDWK